MNGVGMIFGVILIGVLTLIVFLNQGEKSSKILSDNFLTPSTTKSTPTPMPTPTPTQTQKLFTANSATIKTTKGEIILTLYPNEAPNTVANFLSKATNGFYNNLTFHRVEDWVIQGGDPLGNGTGGNSMPTEINDKPFVVGSLGVARGQDIKISNDSQFFIVKKDSVFLNGQYTNFGIVTRGMDVLEKIEVGDKILQLNIEQ